MSLSDCPLATLWPLLYEQRGQNTRAHTTGHGNLIMERWHFPFTTTPSHVFQIVFRGTRLHSKS